MILVGVSVLLKLSSLRFPTRIAVSFVMGAFIVFSYNYAASQSKTQIADWLQNPGIMLDTAVWLTIDVAFQICFCILASKRLVTNFTNKKESIFYDISRWVPGILIFPVLTALLTGLIFSFPGTDFAVIGWSLAIAVLVVAPLGVMFLKWLIPELDIRLELIFLINIIIACLGIVATVNGRTAAKGTANIDWLSLGCVVLLLTSGFIIGFLYYKYVLPHKIKKQK